MDGLITEFVWRCLSKDMYPLVIHHREALEWIRRKWIEGDESITVKSYGATLDYIHKYKKCPDSVDALLCYVRLNPDLIASFQKSEAFDDELIFLRDEYRKSNEDDVYEEPELDDTTLISALIGQARERWLNSVCRFAAKVGLGFTGVNLAGNPFSREISTGVNAAISYLREELSRDVPFEAPALAGILHENIPAVFDGLNQRFLGESTDGRFPLGLSHIDNLVTVGKNGLRFIGVLGMSGDGKTTLTNFITYNWLRQGANILYISTEHTPQEIWEFMTFLHGTHMDYENLELPSLWQWEKGQVGNQDQKNTLRVLQDIERRKNLHGLLDVQQLGSWEAIEAYLEANHQKNHYDILVVDYIARLEVPGDPKFRDKGVSAMVRKAQYLTRHFDGGKGLIVLTPIQVNREGNKKARNASDDEARYDLNAVSQISEYQHDLDLCLSVFSNEEMKMNDQIEIQVLKKRKGCQPPPATMVINTNTGAFEYMHVEASPELQAHWNRDMDTIMAESSTTDISATSWGL